MIRILAGILLGLLILLGLQTCRLGQAQTATAEAREQLAAERAAVALLAQEAERAARAKEAEDKKAMDAIAQELRETIHEGVQELDAVLDQLATAERRLHQRFTCPPSGGGVPGSAGAAEGGHDAPEAGFTQADAEAAFRIAAAGDAAIRQLTACQAVLLAERKSG